MRHVERRAWPEAKGFSSAIVVAAIFFAVGSCGLGGPAALALAAAAFACARLLRAEGEFGLRPLPIPAKVIARSSSGRARAVRGDF